MTWSLKRPVQCLTEGATHGVCRVPEAEHKAKRQQLGNDLRAPMSNAALLTPWRYMDAAGNGFADCSPETVQPRVEIGYRMRPQNMPKTSDPCLHAPMVARVAIMTDAQLAVEEQLAAMRGYWMREFLSSHGSFGSEVVDVPTTLPLAKAPTLAVPIHEPAVGPIADDQIIRCACGVDGVAELSRYSASRPRNGPRTAFKPLQHLESLILPASTLPAAILQQVVEDLPRVRPDDDVVRQGGCGPYSVHLNDSDYRSTRRTRMATCNHGKLKSYHSGTVKPGTESMQHIPPLYWRLNLHVWRAWWHHLPPTFQKRPPDLIHIQPYCLQRRDFMAYHTDTKRDPRRSQQQIAVEEHSPVLLLNVGTDFMYWTREIINGNSVDSRMSAGKQTCIRLEHGQMLMWAWRDDQLYKHGAWPPRDVREGMRWSIVFRWSNGVSEDFYDLEYPHRIIK